MTFEAVFAEAGSLKKILDALSEVFDDVTFECSSSGVDMQAMDSSRVALGVLKMEESVFESLRCEGRMTLGIKLDSIRTFMKCINNNDKLTMIANENSNVVTFKAEEKGDEINAAEFEVKLIDLELEKLQLEVPKYTCVIEMQSKELATMIRNFSTIGDTTKVTSKDLHGVVFSAAGDAGRFKKPINSTSAKKVTLLGYLPELSFSTKYLARFTKSATICDKVIISIDNEYPMMIEYKLSPRGYLRYYFAPKVDDRGV